MFVEYDNDRNEQSFYNGNIKENENSYENGKYLVNDKFFARQYIFAEFLLINKY